MATGLSMRLIHPISIYSTSNDFLIQFSEVFHERTR